MQEEYIETVSIGSCFATILFSAIALCVLLIPISGVAAYTLMPIIGDGNIAYFNEIMLWAFVDFTKISENITQYISLALEYTPYAYMFIPAADIVFAMLLILTRAEFLRKLFRFLSVLFGLVMTIVMLAQLVILIGLIGQLASDLSGITEFDFKIMIFPFAMLIGSSIMSRKQFKWFRAE